MKIPEEEEADLRNRGSPRLHVYTIILISGTKVCGYSISTRNSN